MSKNEFICDCNIIHKEAVETTLKKMPDDDTFNKLFYEIKKDLFQIEKEGFTDALKSLISL